MRFRGLSFYIALSVVAVAVGAFLGIERGASAHLSSYADTWPYSLGSCNFSDDVDPVSVIFWNTADSGNVQSHASHHGYQWADGSNQYFYEHGCFGMTADRANACGTLPGCGARYHFRWKQGYYWDSAFGTYSIATPHYEAWDCPFPYKHFVVGNDWMPPGGFNIGKWQVTNSFMYAGHSAFSSYWANTAPQQQCNGQWAWNDGYVHFIRIP